MVSGGGGREEEIELEKNHQVVILALQEFFAYYDDSNQVNRRLPHDALDEKVHHKGEAWLSVPVASRGPLLHKAVDWLVWKHQPVVWIDSTAAPHNRLYLHRRNAAVLHCRSTAKCFESIPRAVRLLIASRRWFPAVVRLLSI